MNIHPTAIIEAGAQLDTEVTVGAYAYVGAQVTLGKGCHIYHHATVDGLTVMGECNQVHPYAYVGAPTHDLKYRGGQPGLIVGSHNVFREYSTVHVATVEGENTVVGDNNVMLAYSHVAHDCIVGDHLVMSSHAALGGHVVLGNHVNIGWNAGVHQFCRIGDHAMAGACSKVTQDVPPYVIADGNPAQGRTINKIGLERCGYSPDAIALARTCFKLFYKSGHNRTQAIEQLNTVPQTDDVIIRSFVAFIQASERGVC